MNRVAAAIRGFRDPVGLVVRTGRDGGDLALLTGGRRPTFVVTSPDLAREVLETYADAFLKGTGSKASPGCWGGACRSARVRITAGSGRCSIPVSPGSGCWRTGTP